MSNYSYSGIGLKIELDKYGRQELQKVGEHDFNETTLYHPRTGQKLWEEITVYPEILDNLMSGFKVVVNETELKCVGHAKYDPYRLHTLIVFINWVRDRDYDKKTQNFQILTRNSTSIQESYDKLKEIFEPLGMWDNSNFGLWTTCKNDL